MGNIKLIRGAVGSPAGIDFIKLLKERGITIIGIDSNPLASGFLMTNGENFQVPKGDSTDFFPSLKKIIELTKPHAILSGPEEEVIQISKHKEDIEKMGVKTFVPDYPVTEIFTSKNKTQDFFETNNLPCAKALKKSEIKKSDFPLIVKPDFGRGGDGITFVKNQEELELALKSTKTPIIQEILKGDEYTIDVFSDFKGVPLSIVPRVRIEVESGISMKGITVKDASIIELVRKLLSKTKIPGPCCIQGFKNDSGFFFTEVNLRFGGGAILSINADSSILDNLILMIEGKQPKPSEGFKDKFFMLRYYEAVFSDVDSLNMPEMEGVLKKWIKPNREK